MHIDTLNATWMNKKERKNVNYLKWELHDEIQKIMN